MNRKQTGFTIIELVIVIVVLGILAAVAIPRFTDFTGSSRQAVLAGLSGSITSANTQVYAQSLIQGKQTLGNTTTTIPGIDADSDGNDDTVPTRFGYLRDTGAGSTAMQTLLQVSDGSGLNSSNSIAFQVAGGKINAGYDYDADGNVTDDDCHLIYTESTSAAQLPTITYELGGC